MRLKQAILEQFTRNDLKDACDEFGLHDVDRRSPDAMRALLSRTRGVHPWRLFWFLKEPAVKAVAERMGLDIRGRRNAVIDALMTHDANVKRQAKKQRAIAAEHKSGISHKPEVTANEESVRPLEQPVSSQMTPPRTEPGVEQPAMEVLPSSERRTPMNTIAAKPVGRHDSFVPGMRVEIRDAEWRIDRVDNPTHGGKLLTCTGQSELVRGVTARFLTALERDIRVLLPENTELVDDLSSGYMATQLYIHTVLSTTPPSDERIHLGHRAAMDLLPYQLDPALQALKQPRPRILIADAVGLGKTLSAGILVTELIQRHRGKRILVLAVKSMLAQFQREFWQRFTIPLVRLDSLGLQRMRNHIPTNHNPFQYFDRAIISIDTLKQNLEYRSYLENTHWDVVVIDEAHNVAKRSNNSLRHRLAAMLAPRCDAMIMLSATPHDGKPESFASLIHMLDPTAIANHRDYSREDYRDKGLVVRRFKNAVAQQLASSLPEREVHAMSTPASVQEDAAFAVVRSATFKTLNRGTGGGAGQLFRTTIEKALLSSPQACLSTVENRLKRLRGRAADADVLHDIDQLEAIRSACKPLHADTFNKFQLLKTMLAKNGSTIGWNRQNPTDRVVVFTESVVTLDFLAANLPAAIDLPENAVNVLHGGLRDVEQMSLVNEFNNAQSPVRMLLCSDVASEGLNLHHCAHRLIHFDIPWSLMVFQQRNGRVDRYGQTDKPQIYYLMSESAHADVARDQRVLSVLIEKDHQASKNLGDPSEFMGGETVEEQEARTAAAIESDGSERDFSSLLDSFLGKSGDDLDVFRSSDDPTSSGDLKHVTSDAPRVFSGTRAFTRAGLNWLAGRRKSLEWAEDDGVLELHAPADLQQLMRRLPREAIPEDSRFFLTDDTALIQQDMRLARDDETGTFGRLQYLWPQHPVVEWLMRSVQDGFGRHTAPVVRMPHQLASNEHWFFAQGGFPNKRGQALIQHHVAVHFKDDTVVDLRPLVEVLNLLNIQGASLPNKAQARDCEPLSLYLQDAVAQIRAYLKGERQAHQTQYEQRLQNELQSLSALREQHLAQLTLDLDASGRFESVKAHDRSVREKHIDEMFEHYERWLRETWHTEYEPYIQIVAVLTGSEGGPLP